MKKFQQIDCGDRGWFIGNWPNAALQTNNVEVSGQFFVKGSTGSPHYHKIATEITLVVSGKILFNENELGPGEIIVINPNEVSNYIALEDSYLVIVKTPGALNDKYYV